MLSECLQSVTAQDPGPNLEVTLVVIDNNPDTAGRSHRRARSATPPHFPVVVIHEPEPGIPHARNRGLIEALARSADWIVCIDDDEIADPDWLVNLIECGRNGRGRCRAG